MTSLLTPHARLCLGGTLQHTARAHSRQAVIGFRCKQINSSWQLSAHRSSKQAGSQNKSALALEAADNPTASQHTTDWRPSGARAAADEQPAGKGSSTAQVDKAVSSESIGPSISRAEQDGPGKTCSRSEDQASSSGGAEQAQTPCVYKGWEAGYTPFEYVTFSENQMTHEVTIEVDAPVSKVFQIWRNSVNYSEWFDLIRQLVFHKGDPGLVSYFFSYKWGQLPALELYTTLARQAEEENSAILEQSVDGMDVAVGVFFEELAPEKTEVCFRLGYLLPANLDYYVGPVGVWGDVNDTLRENMRAMKEFVESVDLASLEAARAEDQRKLDEKLDQARDVRYTPRILADEEGLQAKSAQTERLQLDAAQGAEESDRKPKRRAVKKKGGKGVS